MSIAINSVISAESDELSGLYRVVTLCPLANVVFLYPLGRRPPKRCRNDALFLPIALDTLLALLDTSRARTVTVNLDPRYSKTAAELSEKNAAIHKRRETVMAPFLDDARLSSCLVSHAGRIGPLVKEAIAANPLDRSTVYDLVRQLATHGFLGASLNPALDRCGAKGVSRPVGAPWLDAKGQLHPPREKAGRKAVREILNPTAPIQGGVTETQTIAILSAWKAIPAPKPKGQKLYDKIVSKVFAVSFTPDKTGELIAQLPPEGTYPSRRQTERIIRVHVSAVNRAQARVAEKYFQRNLRGLLAKAYNGVAGPGHCYAIDSTVGDIFLRSSINRAWYVGRPILYRVVDIWSGVTVAFYLCLSGPSWEQAKVALFCCCAPASMLDELRGFSSALSLFPAPRAPYQLICDRGEYLSRGARETQQAISLQDISYLPSYRADLGGLKEIGFRLIKDAQYGMVYGAIDARRKEIELNRHRYKDSAWTLFEYAEYLNCAFGILNGSKLPKARLTADIVAVGCTTRAELWSFGFAAGVGYAKEIDVERCVTGLLPRDEASVTRTGINFREQNFAPIEREDHEHLTGLARLNGAYKIPVHAYPSTMRCIYWNRPLQGLTRLSATVDAPIQQTMTASYDEWLDALEYRRLDEPTREHAAQQTRIDLNARVKDLNEKARRATAEAEARAEGRPSPSVGEARAMENEGTSHVPQPVVREPSEAPSESRDFNESLKRLLTQLDQ